jgi:hypothetical protein
MKLFISLILLLLLSVNSVNAEPPVIFNGDFAKSLAILGFEHDSGRQLRDCGATVPSGGAGIAAPVGSFCQYSNGVLGALYMKVGAADTAWTDVLGATSGWSLVGNAGTAGTGNLGTTDAANFDIIAGNVTVATIVESYKGISAAPTVIPADATGVNQFNWSTFVSPTVSTNGASHSTTRSELVWDNPNAGFNNANGNLRASESIFTMNGSGTINSASTNINSANFNNGTTTQFKGVTSENTLASGATVTDYNGIVSGINTTGGIFGSHAGISQYAGFTNATLGGQAQGVTSNLTFDGTTTNSQAATGFNSYINFEDSTSTTNSSFGYTSGIDLNNTANINGVYGFNHSINIRDTSDANFVYGLSLGLTQEDSGVSSGTNGINLNYTYGGDATAGNVSLTNFYGRTLDTVDLDSFTVINTNPELEGTSVVDNVTIANLGGQLRQNATFQNVTGINLSTQLSGSAAATNFIPVGIYPQITGTATLTNGFTAVQVAPTVSNAAGVTTAAGLNVDMSNVDLAAASLTAGERLKAITFTGALEGNSDINVPSALTFTQNHYMGGSVAVANGDPIAAYGFGTNLAQTVNFQDDWTIDASALGFSNVGFVGSLIGGTGKTMYSWTGALGGAGNPSGAGTLTNAKMFSAAGILPQGGSLAVTNMYGFEVNPTLFCSIGTNCWGFYEDGTTSENHLSKLAIGTTTKKVANSSTALEIGSLKGFVNGRLTTAQRVALTAVDGMQVYDTDLDALYIYANGAWVAVGSGTGGIAIQEERTGTFGGVDTTYTLTQTPVSNASVVVHLGRVIQRQGIDYTISGTTITFPAEDTSTQNIYAVYRY